MSLLWPDPRSALFRVHASALYWLAWHPKRCVLCTEQIFSKQVLVRGFPGGSVVKNPPAKAGDMVWEDPTCCGATKPVHHNCWGHALKPGSATWEATAMRRPHTATEEWPPPTATRASPGSNEDPAQPKINKLKKKKLVGRIIKSQWSVSREMAEPWPTTASSFSSTKSVSILEDRGTTPNAFWRNSASRPVSNHLKYTEACPSKIN